MNYSLLGEGWEVRYINDVLRARNGQPQLDEEGRKRYGLPSRPYAFEVEQLPFMFKLAPHQPPHPPSEPCAPCVDDDGRWDARVRGQATGQPRDERAAAAASAIAEAEASGVPPWGVVSVPPSVIGARPLATCGIDVRGGEGSAHETKRIWVRGLAAGSFLGEGGEKPREDGADALRPWTARHFPLLVCREGPEPQGKGKEAQRISRLDDYEVTPRKRGSGCATCTPARCAPSCRRSSSLCRRR